jgi:hypothetical protein
MREQLANLLCQNYYRRIGVTGDPDRRDLIPGQLVVAHNVYPPEEPWIVEVLHYHPTDEARCNYRVKRFSAREDRSHMPIAELGLRTDENYYLYIGKERPLIVVREVGSRWLKPLFDEGLVACVPIFSFKPRHNEVFRIKSMGFCYPSLFYLPSDPNGCTEEGAARFELMQPIARKALHNYLKGSPSQPVALSDEAFALFINHLGRYLLDKDSDEQICQDIDLYRKLVLEAVERS